MASPNSPTSLMQRLTASSWTSARAAAETISSNELSSAGEKKIDRMALAMNWIDPRYGTRPGAIEPQSAHLIGAGAAATMSTFTLV